MTRIALADREAMKRRKPIICLRIFDDGVCDITRGSVLERKARFVNCKLDIAGTRNECSYEIEPHEDLWPFIEKALWFLAPPRLPLAPPQSPPE